MSMTKEMIMSVDNEVSRFSNEELAIYYYTHCKIVQQHPNSYDRYKVTKSFQEIVDRGITPMTEELSWV